ncbi:Glycosyltransferase [Heracleum sosnowskyi]|uniref:Glycosyltransferase n=1 Tax=Heracleum sosnowskyi TaxID=360622 RepID=A0AAD8N293_9APIA|nr:Glycosyltransferase [Heracleum sosnowskyi]
MEERLGRELVLIASPLMGHLMPAVELAKLMILREERLSITFILIQLPTHSEVNAFISTLCSTMLHQRLCFITLPSPQHKWTSTNRGVIFDQLLQFHKPQILDTISKLIIQHGVDAIVVDLLSTTLIQLVADEFRIPGYVFFTSSAAFLGLMLHFQTLEDELKEDTGKLKYLTTHLHMPCFVKPVPPVVLPSLLADYATWTARFLHYARGCRHAKGILVNTYHELESYPLSSFSVLDSSSCYGKASSIPEIYAVGPIIYQSMPLDNVSDGLMKWLDDQPPLSVVFLCFGSMGSFGVDQVREIAKGIEQSKCPFVWVLREPPRVNQLDFPTEVVNFGDLLPDGFMNRTAGTGKIMGWVPQLAVLSHRAVGGFVSHCGWNSVLESLWCGVPLLAWPLYAEQKLNAFQMVKELGLAVEIPATVSDQDYKDKASFDLLIKAESIEKGIRRLITEEDGKVIRRKVTQMKEKSRENMQEGGISYKSHGNFIRTVMSSYGGDD